MSRPSLPLLIRRGWLVVALSLGLVVSGCGGSEERTSEQREYVALGDSFTSAPLVPETDPADPCLRSTGNYPARIATQLKVDLTDRSCSGARTEHLLTAQLPGIPAQLEALTSKTDIVTLSIGANDGNVYGVMMVGCTTLMARAAQGAPCRDSQQADGADKLQKSISQTNQQLITIIKEIQKRSPDAEILLVGYPQMVSAANPCRKLPLAVGDYFYVQQLNKALTDALAGAAAATKTTYVDVWTASLGHDVCSKDAWINGPKEDPERAAAYHPFEAEQRAVASLVTEALRKNS